MATPDSKGSRIIAQNTPIGDFTFDYLGSSHLLRRLTYPDGHTSTYDRFSASNDFQLSQIANETSAGANLSRFDYDYDANGNVTSWAQTLQAADTKTYAFSYDSADQLREATLTTEQPIPSTLKRHRYSFDANSNRMDRQLDDSVFEASFDNMNRLLSEQAGGRLAFKGSLDEAATVEVDGNAAVVDGSNEFDGDATVTSGTSDKGAERVWGSVQRSRWSPICWTRFSRHRASRMLLLRRGVLSQLTRARICLSQVKHRCTVGSGDGVGKDEISR